MNLAFIVSVGVAVVVSDVRTRRIPNTWIAAGLLLGAAYQWSAKGPPGILSYLAGVLLPLFLLGPLHAFRMLGAGDVKLLMVMGGLLGAEYSLECIFLSFAIAGIWSVGIAIKHRILVRRLDVLVQYIQTYRQTNRWKPYIRGEEDPAYLNFSIPVVLAGVYLGIRLRGLF